MRKNRLFAIACMSCLPIISMLGCQKEEKVEENNLSYSDMADAMINENSGEDEYYSGDETGEYDSFDTEDSNMGTLDYDNLTEDQLNELLNKQQEQMKEESGTGFELNNAHTATQQKSFQAIKDEDLKLYTSYLLLNVFSDDYVVDTDMTSQQVNVEFGLSDDMYESVFAQKKSDDNSSYFCSFKVVGDDNYNNLTTKMKEYTTIHGGDSLIANSILAGKSIGKTENGETKHIVIFISFNLANREEPLEIPEGYALVEEHADGTYVLEGENMYGEVVQYTGKRITMSTNYREMIVSKLTDNDYSMLK